VCERLVMRFKLIITLAFAFIAACGPTTLNSPGKTLSMWMSEKEILQNKMFFLDTAYRSFYLKRRIKVPDVKAEKLQIWLWSISVPQEAYRNPHGDIYRYFGIGHVPFKLLKMGSDYHLDSRWKGVVMFDSIGVQESDILGIHLETEDSIAIPNKGVYWDSGEASQNIADTLWTLKDSFQDSTHPAYSLMWRNIYRLPIGFDADFKIRIVLTRDASIERSPKGRFFSEVLGLADKNGTPYFSNDSIFDAEEYMLILPAYDSSNHGNEPFSNPALGSDNVNQSIYTKRGYDFLQISEKFKILFVRELPD
jgi:hypothetical protein